MLGSSASVQVVLAAMQKLHWISADFDLANDSQIGPCEHDECWIKWMTFAMSHGCDSISASAACNRLRDLKRDGWVLWERWPRENSSSVEAWLGPRLYRLWSE